MENKFAVDEIRRVKNDIYRTQLKPTQNLSYLGEKGVLQLIKEIVNNAIDEYISSNNISDGIIKIVIDESEFTISVSDTGRGIARESLEYACTEYQSGSKYYRENSSSAGEYGMGLTLVNAMSRVFEITSSNFGYSRLLKFTDGEKIIDKTIECDEKKHGCTVTFRPREDLLCLEEKVFPIKDLNMWIDKISFFLPEFIKVEFTILKKDGSKQKNVIRNSKLSIGGYLSKYEPRANLLNTPVIVSEQNFGIIEKTNYLTDENKIVAKDFQRFLNLKVSINFDTTSNELHRHSFCNLIEQPDHGEHTNGVVDAIVLFFRKKAKDSLKKNEEYDIITNDILNGLCVALCIGTNLSTNFASQTKEKLGNKEFYKPIRTMMLSALDKYFDGSKNKKELNLIIDNIKYNAKSRVKLLESKKKGKLTSNQGFIESRLTDDKYNPPNLIHSNNIKGVEVPLELYIVEGDSAGNNVRGARYDPDLQGIFKIRGKIKNIHWSSSKQVDNCEIWNKLFNKILECGHDEIFNINSLVFDKIIMFTDADVDGGHICSLLTDGIWRHAPELIKQGKLYRLLIPLYKVLGKGSSKNIDPSLYKHNKIDYFNYENDIINKKFKLKINKDNDFMGKDDMLEFLSINKEYNDNLETISSIYTLNKDVLEYLAVCKALYNGDFKRISEFDKNLYYDKEANKILGIYDEKTLIKIILIDELINRLNLLAELINKNQNIYKYHLYEKVKNEFQYKGYFTIGKIMKRFKSVEPAIESRFKGVGEFDMDEILELAMRPDKRQLIRITDEEAEMMSKTFDDIFGGDKTRNIRKEMLNSIKITMDDIDT